RLVTCQERHEGRRVEAAECAVIDRAGPAGDRRILRARPQQHAHTRGIGFRHVGGGANDQQDHAEAIVVRVGASAIVRIPARAARATNAYAACSGTTPLPQARSRSTRSENRADARQIADSASSAGARSGRTARRRRQASRSPGGGGNSGTAAPSWAYSR